MRSIDLKWFGLANHTASDMPYQMPNGTRPKLYPMKMYHAKQGSMKPQNVYIKLYSSDDASRPSRPLAGWKGWRKSIVSLLQISSLGRWQLWWWSQWAEELSRWSAAVSGRPSNWNNYFCILVIISIGTFSLCWHFYSASRVEIWNGKQHSFTSHLI